jgi:DNA invertase Pin-like site-specific DNA recombinase
MNPRRLAVSYTRFSDPKQATGDSETRQQKDFRDFCNQHNLTPLSEVFADRGRSGYKDEHRKKGRLGQLIAMAKDDRFEAGTVIVVEAWDRLGRLRPDKQTALVAELLQTGVSIGVCKLNDIFVEADFGSHKWTVLSVFIQLAYQESKQKADRVASSWAARRERARVKPKKGQRRSLITTLLPAWLECGEDGTVRLIPERAAAVKRIFRLAAEGMGHTRIVKALEQEGVPPFGEKVVHEGRVRSQFSGRWQRPYVCKILNDRRVLGEFQPRKNGGREGGKVRGEDDGNPLDNYFPRVVSDEEFDLARAGQERRLNGDRSKGCRSQGKYVNVFRGLLKHARDGGSYLLHNKGTGAAPALLLVNSGGVGGHGKCFTFPYGVFEEAILGLLREVKAEDVLPRKGNAPSRVDVLRSKLENVRADMASIQKDLKDGYSKALVAVLREHEAAEQKVALELQGELAKTVRPAERAWKDVPGLVDLVKAGGDEARLKIRPVLRSVVDEMLVLVVPRGAWRLCYVQVFFHGGARRDYLLMHRTAGNQREECWCYNSATPALTAGLLDLRDQGATALLQAALEAIDVERLREAME